MTLTNYKEDYWLVNIGEYYGFINDLYIEQTEAVKILKEELKRINKLEKEKIEKENEVARLLANQKKLDDEQAAISKANTERLNRLKSKYGNKVGQDLYDGYVWLGMTKEMATDAFGKPNSIHENVGNWGIKEQWVYYSKYLYFTNGSLSSFTLDK